MTQAARAHALLAAWGVRAQRLRLVSDTDAQVWRVGSHGAPTGDLALRIYRDTGDRAAALDAELDWLRDLVDHGLHVPQPLPRLDGRWRLPLEGGHAIVLRWLPGQQRFDSLRPVHLHRVGVLIAQLHHSAQRREAADRVGVSRPAVGAAVDRLAGHADRLRQWGGAALADAVSRAVQALQQRQSDWPRDARHWGWIHGDLHPWNLLFHSGRAGGIDFSDAGWGFRAQDLAAVLQFLRHPLAGLADHRGQLPRLRDALYAGYQSLRPLTPTLCEQADALHAQRMLNTLQWMLEDWTSPSQRPWGPAFVQQLPQALQQLEKAA